MASQELSMVVNMMKSFRPLNEPTIAEMRAGMEAMAGAAVIPSDVKCEKVSAGGVPAEWVVAENADRARAMLYLHGALNAHDRPFCLGRSS